MAPQRLLPALLILLLAPVPQAEAETRRVVVRQGPFTLEPYQVRYTSRDTRKVRSPRLDGHIVRMHARVVDSQGRPMPVQQVMLHHIVYKTRAHRDEVCGGAESFYGTGEENETLSFPPGYGYRIRHRDRWVTGWMLMNHQAQRRVAYVEYTAWVDTSRRTQGVRPYWVRATGCRDRRDPIFNVPGGGLSDSRFEQSANWTVPRSGRLIAGGSHVHGGSNELRLAQPRCGGRSLMVSRPLYGLPEHPYYNVLPVLHEPGPIATSWLTSAAGIPVRKGERLRVTSVYDGERPHVRVMGIWHLYLAPDRSVTRGCRPLPRDLENGLPSVPGRTEPPAVSVPLTGLDQRGRAITIDRPAGPTIVGGPETDVRVDDLAYRVRNLSVPLDATVRWHFHGSAYHDVTLANGPVGFASRWSLKGDTFSRRFTEPGTYRLFCSLHPIAMTQVIDVGATR